MKVLVIFFLSVNLLIFFLFREVFLCVSLVSKVNWMVINIGFHGKVLVCTGLRPILGLEKMHLVLTIEWRKAASAFWCVVRLQRNLTRLCHS